MIEMTAAEKILDDLSFQLASQGPQTLDHLLACGTIGKHTTVIGNARYKYLTETHDELVAVLKTVKSDCQDTICSYEKDGPTWTGKDGHEYYDASFVIEKMNELINKVESALKRINP